MNPESYFDVAPGMTGGYRVVFIRGRGLQDQAIFDTANDVIAAAKFCEAAILTHTDEIRARCRASGVRLIELRREWR